MKRVGQYIFLLALVAFVISLSLTGSFRVQAANTPPKATASQSNFQAVSPTTCDYSTSTDYFCTLPPGSTIKLPMSAPARTPDPGWYCVAGDQPTQIVYYGGPSPTSDMTVQWVPQHSGSCGEVSGYALVTIGAQARPQYLVADFYLGNVYGECKTGTQPPLCANGIADNGTRWSLNISLPQYVLNFKQQVVTSNFPNGTTPYTFTDYPPAASSSPSTNAATVKCNVNTKVMPAAGQFSYNTSVACNSANGIVGAVSYAIQRTWPPQVGRTDSNAGPTFQCNAQQTCQTSTYTFQTYGNQPGAYIITTYVVLLNPMNDVGLPTSVQHYVGPTYQMVPYNNINTPYPLINPAGWKGKHLPFPDTEAMISFANCPAASQGTTSSCTAYNTSLLRQNTIATYTQKGYSVPSGVTSSSSGQYITQYIKPIECGGNTAGANGAFLQPAQASQMNDWWNNFYPCAPQWTCQTQDLSNWYGNTPPICNNNGAFHRVYSGPGYSNASVTVQLPPFPQIQPGEGANVYLEAWDAQKNPYEAGIQYNPPKNGGAASYQLYARLAIPPYTNNNGYAQLKSATFPHVNPGDKITLTLETAPPDMPLSSLSVNPATDCTSAKACMVFEAQDATSGKVLFLGGFSAAGWNSNGLTFARMTTIAQSSNDFNDGSSFGPVLWSNAKLGKTGTAATNWSGGGAQSWPNDSTRVVITGQTGETGETDTLNLHP